MRVLSAWKVIFEPRARTQELADRPERAGAIATSCV